MTTKPRPKHLTLRPAEVARFLRPSGLVVLPCDPQPVGWSTITGEPVCLTLPPVGCAPVATKPVCPLGGPGSQWVGREAFIPCQSIGFPCKPSEASYVCFRDGEQHYRNGKHSKWTLKDPPNWKAEMHVFLPARRMPDWASRIRKTTTRVELRRVRTITVPECTAYGISDPDGKLGWAPNAMVYAFIEIFNARYPGAWDRDDYAWFVFYTDTLGKD